MASAQTAYQQYQESLDQREQLQRTLQGEIDEASNRFSQRRSELEQSVTSINRRKGQVTRASQGKLQQISSDAESKRAIVESVSSRASAQLSKKDIEVASRLEEFESAQLREQQLQQRYSQGTISRSEFSELFDQTYRDQFGSKAGDAASVAYYQYKQSTGQGLDESERLDYALSGQVLGRTGREALGIQSRVRNLTTYEPLTTYEAIVQTPGGFQKVTGKSRDAVIIKAQQLNEQFNPVTIQKTNFVEKEKSSILTEKSSIDFKQKINIQQNVVQDTISFRNTLQKDIELVTSPPRDFRAIGGVAGNVLTATQEIQAAPGIIGSNVFGGIAETGQTIGREGGRFVSERFPDQYRVVSETFKFRTKTDQELELLKQQSRIVGRTAFTALPYLVGGPITLAQTAIDVGSAVKESPEEAGKFVGIGIAAAVIFGKLGAINALNKSVLGSGLAGKVYSAGTKIAAVGVGTALIAPYVAKEAFGKNVDVLTLTVTDIPEDKGGLYGAFLEGREKDFSERVINIQQIEGPILLGTKIGSFKLPVKKVEFDLDIGSREQITGDTGSGYGVIGSKATGRLYQDRTPKFLEKYLTPGEKRLLFIKSEPVEIKSFFITKTISKNPGSRGYVDPILPRLSGKIKENVSPIKRTQIPEAISGGAQAQAEAQASKEILKSQLVETTFDVKQVGIIKLKLSGKEIPFGVQSIQETEVLKGFAYGKDIPLYKQELFNQKGQRVTLSGPLVDKEFLSFRKGIIVSEGSGGQTKILFKGNKGVQKDIRSFLGEDADKILGRDILKQNKNIYTNSTSSIGKFSQIKASKVTELTGKRSGGQILKAKTISESTFDEGLPKLKVSEKITTVGKKGSPIKMAVERNIAKKNRDEEIFQRLGELDAQKNPILRERTLKELGKGDGSEIIEQFRSGPSRREIRLAKTPGYISPVRNILLEKSRYSTGAPTTTTFREIPQVKLSQQLRDRGIIYTQLQKGPIPPIRPENLLDKRFGLTLEGRYRTFTGSYDKNTRLENIIHIGAGSKPIQSISAKTGIPASLLVNRFNKFSVKALDPISGNLSGFGITSRVPGIDKIGKLRGTGLIGIQPNLGKVLQLKRPFRKVATESAIAHELSHGGDYLTGKVYNTVKMSDKEYLASAGEKQARTIQTVFLQSKKVPEKVIRKVFQEKEPDPEDFLSVLNRNFSNFDKSSSKSTISSADSQKFDKMLKEAFRTTSQRQNTFSNPSLTTQVVRQSVRTIQKPLFVPQTQISGSAIKAIVSQRQVTSLIALVAFGKTKPVTKQETRLRTDSSFKTVPVLKTVSIPITTTLTTPITTTITNPITIPITTTITTPITTTITTPITTTITVPITTPVTVPTTRPLTTPIPFPLFPPPPNQPNIFFPEKGEKKFPQAPTGIGFDVFVKKNVNGRRQFVEIDSKKSSLSERDAIIFGENVVDNALEKSVIIKRSNKPLAALEGLSPVDYKFRFSKTKAGKTVPIYVEKDEYGLDTPGEVSKIQAARVAARYRKLYIREPRKKQGRRTAPASSSFQSKGFTKRYNVI